MKRLAISTLLSTILLTGCAEQLNRVVWSPDGNRVAVVASDGLRMGDTSGNISAPFIPSARLVTWLPDSVHALVVTTKPASSWGEVKGAMSAAECRDVLKAAAKLWRSGPAHEQTVEQHDLASRAFVYLLYRHGRQITTQHFSRQFHTDVESSFHPVVISTLQLFYLSNDTALPLAVVWRTTRTIEDVRVSPSAKLAAVSSDISFSYACYSIVLVSLTGGAPTTVVDSQADSPDWSRDGRYLLYFSYPHIPAGTKFGELRSDSRPFVATLNQIEVADEKGSVLPKLAAPKAVMEALANDSGQVRSLPDGSVMISAKQRSFPSILKSDVRPCLFKLSPDLQSIEPVAASKGLLSENLDYFEPNQDGTKVVVPGDDGTISVIDLTANTVTQLEKQGTGELRFAPHWRTKDELCYPARRADQPAEGNEASVVLQSLSDLSHIVVLSKSWPESATRFLKKSESEDAVDAAFPSETQGTTSKSSGRRLPHSNHARKKAPKH